MSEFSHYQRFHGRRRSYLKTPTNHAERTAAMAQLPFAVQHGGVLYPEDKRSSDCTSSIPGSTQGHAKLEVSLPPHWTRKEPLPTPSIDATTKKVHLVAGSGLHRSHARLVATWRLRVVVMMHARCTCLTRRPLAKHPTVKKIPRHNITYPTHLEPKAQLTNDCNIEMRTYKSLLAAMS